jgi:hypothetical protein
MKNNAESNLPAWREFEEFLLYGDVAKTLRDKFISPTNEVHVPDSTPETTVPNPLFGTVSGYRAW